MVMEIYVPFTLGRKISVENIAPILNPSDSYPSLMVL